MLSLLRPRAFYEHLPGRCATPSMPWNFLQHGNAEIAVTNGSTPERGFRTFCSSLIGFGFWISRFWDAPGPARDVPRDGANMQKHQCLQALGRRDGSRGGRWGGTATLTFQSASQSFVTDQSGSKRHLTAPTGG